MLCVRARVANMCVAWARVCVRIMRDFLWLCVTDRVSVDIVTLSETRQDSSKLAVYTPTQAHSRAHTLTHAHWSTFSSTHTDTHTQFFGTHACGICTHTYTYALTQENACTHTHRHSPTVSFSRSLSVSLRPLSLYLSHSLSFSLSLTHTHPNTHTYTRTRNTLIHASDTHSYSSNTKTGIGMHVGIFFHIRPWTLLKAFEVLCLHSFVYVTWLSDMCDTTRL